MTNVHIIEVDVTQRVRVTFDASKFDQQFADEFNTSIFYAGDPTDVPQMLAYHAEHIGQLQGREIWDNRGFVEGYGKVQEMAIVAETLSITMEVVSQKPGNGSDEWRPIEEAPRDGRSMQLADETGMRAAAYWTGTMWAYAVADLGYVEQVEFEPTRFRGPFGPAIDAEAKA
jgi:hypothetical protein